MQTKLNHYHVLPTWLVQGVRRVVVVLKEGQYWSSLLQGIVSLAFLYGLPASPDPDLSKHSTLLTAEKRSGKVSSRGQQIFDIRTWVGSGG